MSAILSKIENFYKSMPLKQLFIILILACPISYGITHFSKIEGFAIAVILIFAISLLRIDWAICMFIFLCPFHYVFKAIYPSLITDLWREGFFLCILGSWFIHVCLKKLPLPPQNNLNLMIIAYILWGAIEILRSFDLLVGLGGFRFMFAFVPLYFIAFSTIKGEREIKRYIYAVLLSGFIVACYGIFQFVLVSLLKIVEPGTSIDFVRKNILTFSTREEFYRATSVLLSTNELGNFLSVCIVFLFALNYHSSRYKSKHHKKLIFSIIIMVIALLFTMSRSAMFSLVLAILAISFLKSRTKPILIACLGIVALSLILPYSINLLFKPVYSFTDPYFTGTWRSQDLWGPFWQSPLLGHGFSLTKSAAEKLNISTLGVTSIGASDIDFFMRSTQIGLIGYSLYFFIWILFLRNAYVSAKNISLSETGRTISLGIFGVLVALMVTSLHASPLESVSLSGTYWLIGAIVSKGKDYRASKEKKQ